jgi:hypothetical protein
MSFSLYNQTFLTVQSGGDCAQSDSHTQSSPNFILQNELMTNK